ncbi:MAG: hypothetical protein ACLQVY_24955 [Limisphaerales bacterium]
MVDSPYYPRRANGFSRFWYFGHWLSRTKPVDLLMRAQGLTLLGFALSFLIPGMGIFLRRRVLGWPALAACLVAALVFPVALGYPAANYAVGVLLSIHVLGLTYYLQPLWQTARLSARIVATLALFLMVLSGLYLPLLHYCEREWFMPVRFHGKVVIIHSGTKIPALERGDWAAYRYEGWAMGAPHAAGGAIHVPAGLNIAPVIGLAGDEVQFTSTNLLVNGMAQPALPGMPTSGGLTVPEKDWFFWADFGIVGHGVTAQAIADARVHAGFVQTNQYVGAPFHWWFWRNQSLP